VSWNRFGSWEHAIRLTRRSPESALQVVNGPISGRTKCLAAAASTGLHKSAVDRV